MNGNKNGIEMRTGSGVQVQQASFAAQIDRLSQTLPQMRTEADLKELQTQGFEVPTDYVGKLNVNHLRSERDRLGFASRGVLSEARRFYAADPDPEAVANFETACVDAIRPVLGLILSPPPKLDVSPRNPKQELPQLAKLALRARLDGSPIPFVVPCCPDTSGYQLGDGLGDVVPKGLDHCERLSEFFGRYGFAALFEVQIADVEGLDPVILASSGETSESHFAKTAETIRKTRALVAERGASDFVRVSSMQGAFEAAGISYANEQAAAAERIASPQNKGVRTTVDGLLAERTTLGNFSRFDEPTRSELVVSELAGYAAYGRMVCGSAVILSPDAASAIPAYHYALDAPEQFSPVMYAK